MAVFPEPNLTADNFVPEFFTDVSESGLASADGNIMGIVFLFGMVLVSFVGSKRFGFPRAFTFSTFFGSVLSLLMGKLGWVNSGTIYLCIALFIISLFLLFLSDR